MARLSLLALLLLLSGPSHLQAQDCFDGVFCLIHESVGDTVHVYVDNLRPVEITIILDLDLDNMSATRTLPVTATYPGRSRTYAASLVVQDRYEPSNYVFKMQWVFGNLDARHDDTYRYTLPYAPGTAHQVVQGFNGRFSHEDTYAIDWSMDPGTPIYATRNGVIADVQDTYHGGGVDPALKSQANYVRIRHSDGTSGQYAHLLRGGARVQVGQRVRQGELIGLSGNTGYSSGPHLHFEVFVLNPDLSRRSVPVRFEVQGQVTTLKEGRVYRK